MAAASTPESLPQDAQPSQHISRKETLHQPEEWELMRPIIRELYIDEKRTLADVSHTLEVTYNFRATPKQYKNRFKQWGYWKNLSTRDASRLIQMKASRESMGKTSTFLRSGQKVDLDRIQKSIRRSRNRAPKSKAKDISLKRTEAKPEQTAALNLPSGIECRTPSPEPPPAQEDLSLYDPNVQFISPHIDYEFDNFGEDAVQPQASRSHTLDAFTPSVAGQLERFDNYHYHDPRIEVIWDYYSTALRKLALISGRLRSSVEPDPGLQLFKHKNTLLAILEPVIPKEQLHLRELFLRNLSETFSDRPEFPQFAQHVMETIGVGSPMSGGATDVVSQEIDAALQFTGIPTGSFTRRFLEAKNGRNASGLQPSPSDEHIVVATGADIADSLSPGNTSPSPGIEFPITPPSSEHTEDGPQVIDLEAATLTCNLGEIIEAEVRLRGITAYEGSVSTKGQVLIRLAWYCLCCILRQSGRTEEAVMCLIQAVRGSTYYSETNGTEWEEVSYLFS
ncbi:hypothetical protein VPNG_01969 [Cytospora leucostoma]|uniref:Clr5 domain-containing protein n=1 Tax=Cytospora leucostoma TaxID=1230097 RepID=A0A423XIA8_9PEZI|nr:hypothetical protein VPNG_01969 [Cytospora leucostoma]